MPPELDPNNTTNPNPVTSEKTYTDEEIAKILNTAKATRKERDEIEKRAREVEDSNKQLQSQLEQIKTIDPKRYQELETLAAQYEDRKLEEQKQFAELKERWGTEKGAFQQQIQKMQESLQQERITNVLEKAFYSVGGKIGKDEDGYSYFDLVRDRASKFIQVGDDGKLRTIDPRDGTKLTNEKGLPLTIEDLMVKLRSSGPTAALFEPANNASGGGSQRSIGSGNNKITTEQLASLPRAERLAKVRELGL